MGFQVDCTCRTLRKQPALKALQRTIIGPLRGPSKVLFSSCLIKNYDSRSYADESEVYFSKLKIFGVKTGVRNGLLVSHCVGRTINILKKVSTSKRTTLF